MIIVDSVGWIAYLAKSDLASYYRVYILDTKNLITPGLVVYEVHKHVLKHATEDSAKLALSALLKTRVVPLNEGIAVSASRLSIEHKLPMADAIIYATSLSTGASVVTSDVHFENLPQVKYIPR